MRSTDPSVRRRTVVCALAAGVILMTAPAPALATGVPSASSAPGAAKAASGSALQRARLTGKPVPITGATTATDTLTANPDGTLSFRRSLMPQRKYVDGRWVGLDATLKSNPDGSVSPTMSTQPLVLSGGGTGPLARMGGHGRSVAFGLPVKLPRPSLSGDTATYAGVLPGVDLLVRADRQGGFSEVLVVRNAAAASHPALRALTITTATDGITLSADATGNVVGTDRTGQAVLSAPAPQMWDSAKAYGPTMPDLRSGRALDKATGQPAASDARTPGVAARRAPIAVEVTDHALKLVPDQEMLAGSAVTFPLFLDPSFAWTPINPTRSAWASVAHKYAASNYWNNTPDPDGHLQVGNSNEGGGGIWSHSLLNFAIPVSTLSGAIIDSAVIDMTEVWAWSCTASRVNIYAPAATMTPTTANWNYWNGQSLGSVIDYKDVAYKAGNTSCPAHGVSFNVLSAVNADVAAGKTTQTFVMTGVNESTDWNSWKEFDLNSVAFTVTYNHPPNTPTAAALTTSPSTSCQAVPSNAVGAGDVSLYAQLSDPDPSTVLGVQFELWKTSAPGTILAGSDPLVLTVGSGGTISRVVTKSILETAAGGAQTSFSWRVRGYDGAPDNGWSNWSPTCAFVFDPTRPAAPTVAEIPENATTIGQSYSMAVTKPTGSSNPGSYLVQLNGAAPVSFPADGSGNATITFKPNRHTNVLSVTSLSPGGNVGASAQRIFVAQPGPDRPDGDLSGDGAADLVAVGGSNNITSGLWLGTGRNTGQVQPSMTNIGARGIGLGVHDNAADYDDAIALTGHFFGSGLQDVLVYYPAGYRDPAGANTGGGVIIEGYGDGSVLSPIGGATLPEGLFNFGDGSPVQLVNAGDTTHRGQRYADLLGIVDTGASSYLDYYPNNNMVGGYGWSEDRLSVTTPAGDMNWAAWTLAAAQTAGGTSLFLWNKATGQLYLWKDLSHTMGETTLSYTQYALADGTAGHQWNMGVSVRLSAGDANGDGVADLWTVGSTGTATTYLVTGLSGGTGTATAQPAQPLISAAHHWALADAGSGSVATAADQAGTANLTGSGNAVWNTGDLFSPDVSLNGTTAALATAGKALDTNADFTVDAWVRPAAAGTVASQDGSNTAGFRVYLDGSTNSWRFSMPTGDVAGGSADTAASANGTAQLGVWTRITATYRSATQMMNLAANGVTIATAAHAPSWNATGAFRVGTARTSPAAFGGYLGGQVANVQVWGQAVDIVGASRTLLADARADILRKDNGSLFAYYNGGLTAGKGVNWDSPSNGYTAGSGFSVADSSLYFADIDGNGWRDLVRKAPDGTLTAYYNPTAPYNATASWTFTGTAAAIGSGWTMADSSVYFADLDGNGRDDLIKKLNGILEVYWNRGVLADGRVSWEQYDATHGYTIGSGWDMPGSSIYFTDISGDGYADIVSKHTDGTLGAYYNGGVTAGMGINWVYVAGGYGIGSGWYMPDSALYFADINGDGRSDITRKDTGNLQTYYNGGVTGSWGILWDYPPGGYVISTGWGAYPDSSVYIG